MAIQVQEGFYIATPVPLDARTILASVAERDQLRPYDGMLVYVKDEAQHYLYKQSNWCAFPEVAETYHLVKYTQFVEAVSDNQREFEIPIPNYDSSIHYFDVVVGSVFFSSLRYTISGNKIIFNESEDGIEKGRRVDFVITYLQKQKNATRTLQKTTKKKRKTKK